MANLTIRNVDDEVVEMLKAKAKAHNRWKQKSGKSSAIRSAGPLGAVPSCWSAPSASRR